MRTVALVHSENIQQRLRTAASPGKLSTREEFRPTFRPEHGRALLHPGAMRRLRWSANICGRSAQRTHALVPGGNDLFEENVS